MVSDTRNITAMAPNMASLATPWSTWMVVPSQAYEHQHHHRTASMTSPCPTPAGLRWSAISWVIWVMA